MAIFSVRGVSQEVQRAVRIRAAETGETIGQITERALRRELGMMEARTLTWQVLEDNGGGLHLAVFDEQDNCIYYASGYEHNEDGLRADVQALREGQHPIRDGWEGSADDPQAAYDGLIGYAHAWTVVADDEGVYYDHMGAAARRVFMVPWQKLQLFDRDNDPVTDPEQIAAALAEFRDSGAMNGIFFARIGWPHEDEDDASTWGPPSPDAVDWTGFPS